MMNASQRRAWAALGLGPAWQARVQPEVARGDLPEGAPAQREAPSSGAVDALVIAPAPAAVPASAPAAVPMPGILPDGGSRVEVSQAGWSELRAMVSDCRACGLCESRTRTVFGVGPESARWMLIGEAPGADEDATGEPFVGRAGKLLDNMLASIGLDRQRNVFIANVLKCRPPRNRDPQPDEVERCSPYLLRQIELLAPDVIVVTGRFSASTLLETDDAIGRLRGRVHRYRLGEREIPVIVTYHPAYLLRRPEEKAKAWADLCLARSVLRE